MDFYEYLGVKPSATTEEIQNAFRSKAKHTHPDYNKKNTAFFEMVELNLARETLLNPDKRAEYDRKLKDTTHKDNEIHHTDPHSKKKSSLFHSLHRLFKYHCIVCGREMSSTWKGFCLYHYLEKTDQLNNDDFIFEYNGQLYQWADPPEELIKEKTMSMKQNLNITKAHIALYLFLLLLIAGFVLIFVVSML